jgi:GTP pyrophosphokinase
LALKESQAKEGLFAKELLERRFKNRKIDLEESIMQMLIKKMGYKEVSEFYLDIANEQLDTLTVIERYTELKASLEPTANTGQENAPARSAAEFVMRDRDTYTSTDVLVIDRNLKGVDYTLAKCCHPIYGDDVFGFITVMGGIKIHRTDCPNAAELRRRFGYRIVRAKWSGKGNGQYDITLQVVGNDDIGIVSNITNLISKESHAVMRSINIDSNDGLFKGTITVQVDETKSLDSLIKKLHNIKGVKRVSRI